MRFLAGFTTLLACLAVLHRSDLIVASTCAALSAPCMVVQDVPSCSSQASGHDDLQTKLLLVLLLKQLVLTVCLLPKVTCTSNPSNNCNLSVIDRSRLCCNRENSLGVSSASWTVSVLMECHLEPLLGAMVHCSTCYMYGPNTNNTCLSNTSWLTSQQPLLLLQQQTRNPSLLGNKQ